VSARASAAVRSSAAVTGSVAAFALLIETGGLVPAVAAAAFVASLGSPAVSIRHALLLSLALAVAMTVIFVGLLDQPITPLRGF
jgi:hypothetical protein